MLTKTQLAQHIVAEHEKNGIVGESMITQSSQLAVAMEHLGLIQDEQLQDYAASRGGVVWSCRDGCLTLREVMSLLPD